MHGLCALVHELVGTVSMCMNYIAGTGPIMHASQAGIKPVYNVGKHRHYQYNFNMAIYTYTSKRHVYAGFYHRY